MNTNLSAKKIHKKKDKMKQLIIDVKNLQLRKKLLEIGFVLFGVVIVSIFVSLFIKFTIFRLIYLFVFIVFIYFMDKDHTKTTNYIFRKNASYYALDADVNPDDPLLLRKLKEFVKGISKEKNQSK